MLPRQVYNSIACPKTDKVEAEAPDESSEEQQKQQAKDIFKRLSAFSEACQEKVFDRFPNVAVYAHFSSLLEVTDARARLPLEHVSGLASFYQVPEESRDDYVAGWRRLWAE